MGHTEKDTTNYGPRPKIGFNGQKPRAQEEMESCVLCGKSTIYPKNMHIDYRMYYVEGVGQLCTECYEITYNEKPRA